MKVLASLFRKIIHQRIPSRLQFNYQEISFRFPRKVTMRGISFSFGGKHVNMDQVEITVNNPLLLLLARKRFLIVSVKCGIADVLQQPSQQATAADPQPAHLPKKNYIRFIHIYLNRFFQQSTVIAFQRITWKHFVLQDVVFSAQQVQFNFQFRSEKMQFRGELTPSDNEISIKGHAAIQGSRLNVESIDITGRVTHSNEELLIHYSLDGKSFLCNTRKISPIPVSVAGFQVTDQIKINQTTVENDMDIAIGDMPFKIANTLTYDLSKVLNIVVATRLDKHTMAWLFPYLVTDIKSIQSEGGITIITNLGLNLDNVFGHKFDVFVQDYDFMASDLTVLKLDQLNYPFTQMAYKDGLAVRKLRVKNGYFDKYENTDGYQLLRRIIVFCEDRAFLQHKGVAPYFIGKAIVTNIKEKKFSRGGSTITMQVIRNLFLSADKSLIRKVEEVVLSLLLENHAGISKSRILDIYLQIVELGPNIYGVKEGANYYFGKQLHELNLVDCVVLTYILPRPVFFNDALLIRSSQLQKNLSTYCRNVSLFLKEYGILTDETYDSLLREVVFSKRWDNYTITFGK
ncbi:transglycosylase [Chitinophaga dinghuensis]|uniref:Transglycosylase n=1 Tax=Chitinophaga dinghuensis TaxID=1539050 RepID=A0A327VQG8_9BACT|nr:biosynthetic peptidoglycan transglycosylase [Chitinophaga dinghuensis]RAJ76607.1 transglycosylase [Chitinophaga dinghuensis]